MHAVTRKEFLDRWMDLNELEALVHMWNGWFRLSGALPKRHHCGWRWEARWQGFPRARGEALELWLQRQAMAAGLPATFVGRPDPDTLTLESFIRGLGHPGNLELLFAAASNLKFADLTLMLRLTAGSWLIGEGGEPSEWQTLVLFGLVREGRFQLKTLWPAETATEGIYEHTDWPAETEFLAALGSYREVERCLQQELPLEEWSTYSHKMFMCSDSIEAVLVGNALGKLTGQADEVVPTGPAVSAPATVVQFAQAVSFVRRSPYFREMLSRSSRALAQKVVAGWLRLSGQRSLPAFLFLLACFIVPALLCFAIFGELASQRRGWFFLLLGAALIGGAAREAWKKGRTVRLYRLHLKAGLKDLYSGPVPQVPVSLEDHRVAEDPSVRKSSRDVEALGARHHVDFTCEITGRHLGFHRLYLLPEERTYLTMFIIVESHELRMFPARTGYHLLTYFADGSRLVCANSGVGFRKLSREVRATVRFFPDATDPAALLARHRAVLQRLLRQGSQLAPFEPAEILQRQKREHEEACQFAAKGGYYTWSDALHEVFGIVRREYKEPLEGNKE
jgi:hypothetical protein